MVEEEYAIPLYLDQEVYIPLSPHPKASWADEIEEDETVKHSEPLDQDK
jgi:hypothetical protein